MRTNFFALILLLTYAADARAGAWLRGEGGGFASTALTVNPDRELSTSVYLEYGLTATRTLGADISYGVDRTGVQEGSGILFLRMPLGPPDQTHKFAMHFGVGARVLNGEYFPAVEAGFSWGRGIKVGDKYGWVNVDSSFNLTQSPAENRVKLDATGGLGLSERTKVMLQMFNTFQDGDVFAKFAPSLLFTPKNNKTTLQFGAEFPVSGGGEPSIRLAVWREW